MKLQSDNVTNTHSSSCARETANAKAIAAIDIALWDCRAWSDNKEE